MKTWNKELKQHWIDTMQEHQDADRIIQGDWWNGSKGCFFGCAMQTDESPLHKAIEAMQLPGWLVHFAEAIHEGLPKEEAMVWPVQLCKAIPCDADIEVVQHKIAIKRLTPLAEKNPSVASAINEVICCHEKAIAGESGIDWELVKSADRSADRSVAWSAERSVARSAERSAWQEERDNLIAALSEISEK